MRTSALCLTATGLLLWMVAAAQADIWTAELDDREIHPCLAFTKADLPAIRERVQRPPYSVFYSAVKSQPGPVAKAFLWAVEADEEAAEAARRMLLRADPDGYHCACGTGGPMQVYAEAYDMLFDYPGLTETDHGIIRKKLATACERMYLSGLRSGPGQNAGNQRVRGLSGLGAAALVIRGYKDAAHTPQEWLQRVLDGIHQEDNLRFFRPDGMFIEGPDYASFTMSLMMTFARYYEKNCGKWLFDEPALRNALQYLVYITQPDGRCAGLGTTNYRSVIRAVRPAIGAGLIEDQEFYRWATDEWSSIGSGTWRDMMLFDDTVKPSKRAFAPTRFFPVSQEAHLRSAWSRTAVCMWLKGKDPWLAKTYRVYSHGDVASFSLHAYGELLAVDAGYDHWVSYELYAPELHNCLLVDGKGPVNDTPGLLKNPLATPFVEAADITATYEGVEHTRTVVFPDKRYFVFTDDIVSAEQKTYQWQLHSPVTRGKAEISIDGNRTSWTGYDPTTDIAGNVKLDTIFAGPVSVRPMEKSRWQPFNSDPKTGSYDNWAVVAERMADSCRYLVVLYPHPTAVTPPDIQTPQIDGGLCATITARAHRDIALACEGEGPASFEKLSTTCRTAMVREAAGRILWAYANGAGRVEHDGKLVVELGEGSPCAVAIKFDSEGPSRLYFTGEEPAPRISVPVRSDQTKILRLDATGRWQDVAATVEGGRLSFQATDAAQRGALVLFGSPTKLVLDDDAAPQIAAVEIDGEAQSPAEQIDLGHVREAPGTLAVEFVEDESALDLTSLAVTGNGLPLKAEVQTKLSDDGQRLRVAVDLAELVGRMDYGVTVAVSDLAAEGHIAAFTLKFSTASLLANAGFELGSPSPRNWSTRTWSSDENTKYEMRTVEDNPRSGKRCLLMRGIAGRLNLCTQQDVKLQVGKSYVFSGYRRGDAPSSCSVVSDGGRIEYLNSPAWPPSDEWAPFSWEFKVSLPAASFTVVVRHGSVGSVYFDDLSLEQM